VTINIKDLKKLKVASPDHPIYNGKYQVYPVNSLEDYLVWYALFYRY